MKQAKPCPRCKEAHGWFEKRVITGTQFFMPDGDISHFNDESSRGGRRKYCAQCSRDITKLIQ